MTTIRLPIDPTVLDRARKVASERHATLESLIAGWVEKLARTTSDDPFLGMFHDDAELIDEIVADAHRSREQHPIRVTDD